MPHPGMPGGFIPRKRKSNNTALVVIAVVVFMLFGLGTVGVGLATFTNDSSASASSESSEYSSEYGSESSDSTDTSGSESSESTSDSGSRSDSESPSAQPGPKKVVTLADNPIHTVASYVPDVHCPLPTDLGTPTPQSIRTYTEAAAPCLNQGWSQVMQKANLPWSPPNLAFPSGANWSSPCGAVGSDTAAAFYCSSNNTIYMPFEGLNTDRYGRQYEIYLGTFSHEYGHHIQELAGIMDAWSERAYNSGGYDSPFGLEMSRRSELQASCFGGQYLASAQRTGSITTKQATNALDDRFQRGDGPGKPRDHGSNDNQGKWSNRGYKLNSTADCNTWSASEAETS